MDTNFHLDYDKVWIIDYLRGKFQKYTSISVPMAATSELASTFTPSILCRYLFLFSLG